MMACQTRPNHSEHSKRGFRVGHIPLTYLNLKETKGKGVFSRYCLYHKQDGALVTKLKDFTDKVKTRKIGWEHTCSGSSCHW